MDKLKDIYPNISSKVKDSPDESKAEIIGDEWNDAIKEIDNLRFSSIDELRTRANTNTVGDIVFTSSRDNDEWGGGGKFKCVSIDASTDNYIDNGGTIIVTADNCAFEMQLMDTSVVDIAVFGAKGGVQFSDVKVLYIPPSANPIGVVPDCSDALIRAITWLDRNRVVFPASAASFKIPVSTLLVNAHYLLDPQGLNPVTDVAITVPNGISIQGNGTFHTNYSGINFLFDEHYGTDSEIRVYKQLWRGLNVCAEWYVKGTDTEPIDLYSQGVILNSSRRTRMRVETVGFVHGCRLEDSKVVGCVDNVFDLGNILNNKNGVSVQPIAGGSWCNQNIFNGGSIKLVGYSDRSTTIKTPCSAINLTGNNNVFINTNLEGNSNYQYVIHDKGSENIFVNPRLENSTFSGQVFTENQGSMIQGGYGIYPNATGTLSNYENIDGTEPTTKRGFVQNFREQSSEWSKGQIRLTGRATTEPAPSHSLHITNSQGTENYIALGKNIFKSRHIFYGEDRNGAIELHTQADEYVDLMELHKQIGIFNVITHVQGNWAGVGDWIDDTATSGNWYFVKDLYQMGVSLEEDILDTKVEAQPTSRYPFLLEEGVLSLPSIRGIKEVIKASGTEAEDQKGALNIPMGTFDNATWQRTNTADLKYNMHITDSDLAVNTDDTDLLLYSSSIMLRNLDSGGETRNVNLTKKTIRYFAGRRFFFYHTPQSAYYNYVSHPIVLKNISGGDVVLNQGDWCEVVALIDGNTTSGTLILLNRN